jgi:hypothetical protein
VFWLAKVIGEPVFAWLIDELDGDPLVAELESKVTVLMLEILNLLPVLATLSDVEVVQ